ncbi:MAG TPA: sorbosone dehydrogenase family protein, partial [Burkholderiales bacterium]|nr:sorbosone dehydrogenase family protein [Burkholderiales bacterium]
MPGRKTFAPSLQALRGCVALLALAITQHARTQSLPLERIKLPPGFEISVFAGDIPEARSLALGKNNVLFVGTRADRVYAVRYRDAKATQVITIASGLTMPNGVAVRDGALYVAEVNRILRFDDIEAQLDARP